VTERRLIRVAPPTVVLFAVLCSPALAAGVWTLWRGALRDGAVLCALYEVGVALLCSARVELAEGQVVHRPWPWQARKVDLVSVSSAWLAVGPGVTLVLARGPRDDDAVVLNVRPFSEAGAAAILAHVRAFDGDIPVDVTGAGLEPADAGAVAREGLFARRLLRGILAGAAILALAAAARWALH
jgi:hypothetical protein